MTHLDPSLSSESITSQIKKKPFCYNSNTCSRDGAQLALRKAEGVFIHGHADGDRVGRAGLVTLSLLVYSFSYDVPNKPCINPKSLLAYELTLLDVTAWGLRPDVLGGCLCVARSRRVPFFWHLEGGEAAMLSSTVSVEEIPTKFHTSPVEVTSDVSDFQDPFLARSSAVQYSTVGCSITYLLHHLRTALHMCSTIQHILLGRWPKEFFSP